MRLLLSLLALPLMAQQRLSSPVSLGGRECGELRLLKAFPNSGQYMAWRNCENVGEMSMELINNANEMKAKFVNSPSGTLTLFNSSSQTGLFMSGFGALQGFHSGVQRFTLSAVSGIPRLDLKDASGVNIARVDGTGTGGLFTSAGNEVALSQTGDSLGSMSLICRNRFAEGGCIVFNPSFDVVDWMMRGSSGTQRNLRLENRFTSGLTFLANEPEHQLGDMTNLPNGIGLMANTNGAGVHRGDYFRWLGSTSGYFGLRGPATGPNIDWTLPPGSGASGQCWGYSSAGVLAWVTCGGSGGGSFVDLTSAQTITGVKYASNAFDANTVVIRQSSSGLSRLILDGSGSIGGQATWNNGSGASTAQLSGDNSGVAALVFRNPATSAVNFRIQGGQTSSLPFLELYNSAGAALAVEIRHGGSLTGGVLGVYTNSGNQAVIIDGSGNGRIRVSDGSVLQTGQTTTVVVPCGTLTFTMGILTSKGAC